MYSGSKRRILCSKHSLETPPSTPQSVTYLHTYNIWIYLIEYIHSFSPTWPHHSYAAQASEAITACASACPSSAILSSWAQADAASEDLAVASWSKEVRNARMSWNGRIWTGGVLVKCWSIDSWSENALWAQHIPRWWNNRLDLQKNDHQRLNSGLFMWGSKCQDLQSNK